MSIFNEQAQVLVERFVQLAQEKTLHQLYPYISACTLDIITGIDFDCVVYRFISNSWMSFRSGNWHKS